MAQETSIDRFGNAGATATRWRALARETQATAEKIDDPRERLALLLIARAYAQLAKTAERIHCSSKEERAPDRDGEPRRPLIRE
jgi:hypothetical protein